MLLPSRPSDGRDGASGSALEGRSRGFGTLREVGQGTFGVARYLAEGVLGVFFLYPIGGESWHIERRGRARAVKMCAEGPKCCSADRGPTVETYRSPAPVDRSPGRKVRFFALGSPNGGPTRWVPGSSDIAVHSGDTSPQVEEHGSPTQTL